MRQYELTYLVSDEVLEKDLNKITGKVSEIISAAGGKVQKEEIWGRRKLSYPIQKQNFANYVTLWVELEGEKVAEINHELQVLTGVIRHLLIIKTAGSEKITVTKEDVVADEELEEVIGEKGVEIVKGETEESYDLMAKRETEKEEDEPKSEEKSETKAEKKEVKTDQKEDKSEKEEIKEEKIKKSVKKTAGVKTKSKKTTPKADKPEKKTEKNEENTEDEADRIKKLDEKLDELLGDDI